MKKKVIFTTIIALTAILAGCSKPIDTTHQTDTSHLSSAEKKQLAELAKKCPYNIALQSPDIPEDKNSDDWRYHVLTQSNDCQKFVFLTYKGEGTDGKEPIAEAGHRQLYGGKFIYSKPKSW